MKFDFVEGPLVGEPDGATTVQEAANKKRANHYALLYKLALKCISDIYKITLEEFQEHIDTILDEFDEQIESTYKTHRIYSSVRAKGNSIKRAVRELRNTYVGYITDAIEKYLEDPDNNPMDEDDDEYKDLLDHSNDVPPGMDFPDDAFPESDYDSVDEEASVMDTLFHASPEFFDDTLPNLYKRWVLFAGSFVGVMDWLNEVKEQNVDLKIHAAFTELFVLVSGHSIRNTEGFELWNVPDPKHGRDGVIKFGGAVKGYGNWNRLTRVFSNRMFKEIRALSLKREYAVPRTKIQTKIYKDDLDKYLDNFFTAFRSDKGIRVTDAPSRKGELDFACPLGLSISRPGWQKTLAKKKEREILKTEHLFMSTITIGPGVGPDSKTTLPDTIRRVVRAIDGIAQRGGVYDDLKALPAYTREAYPDFKTQVDAWAQAIGATNDEEKLLPMDVERHGHAMVCVGYGYADDEIYYIIKNSHGEDTGDHGYLRYHNALQNCSYVSSKRKYEMYHVTYRAFNAIYLAGGLRSDHYEDDQLYVCEHAYGDNDNRILFCKGYPHLHELSIERAVWQGITNSDAGHGDEPCKNLYNPLAGGSKLKSVSPPSSMKWSRCNRKNAVFHMCGGVKRKINKFGPHVGSNCDCLKFDGSSSVQRIRDAISKHMGGNATLTMFGKTLDGGYIGHYGWSQGTPINICGNTYLHPDLGFEHVIDFAGDYGGVPDCKVDVPEELGPIESAIARLMQAATFKKCTSGNKFDVQKTYKILLGQGAKQVSIAVERVTPEVLLFPISVEGFVMGCIDYRNVNKWFIVQKEDLTKRVSPAMYLAEAVLGRG